MFKRKVTVEQIAQWCDADTGEIACTVEREDLAPAAQGVEPVGYAPASLRFGDWSLASIAPKPDASFCVPVYLSPPAQDADAACDALLRQLKQRSEERNAALAAQRKAEQASSDFEDHAKQSERRTSLAEKRAIAAESRAAACENVVEIAGHIDGAVHDGKIAVNPRLGPSEAYPYSSMLDELRTRLAERISALPSPAAYGDAPAIEFPLVVEAVVSRDEPAPERTCGECTVGDAVLVENRKLHAMVATLRRCAECGCCAKESCSSRDVNATATRRVQGWANADSIGGPSQFVVYDCEDSGLVPVTVTWIPTGEPK
jgi:hypothetical protein